MIKSSHSKFDLYDLLNDNWMNLLVICLRILGNFLSTLFKASFRIRLSLISLKEQGHSHLWKKSKIKPPLFLNKVATLMFCFFIQGTKQGLLMSSSQQWDSGHIIDINCSFTSNSWCCSVVGRSKNSVEEGLMWWAMFGCLFVSRVGVGTGVY